jgi:predicted AlkP superfamily phosphohydrolase/phosphomutase
MPTFQPYDRILILALDSVCWDMLLPLAQDGTMSALAAFLRRAHYGVLESTIPPHTAAAWSTFLTGKDPGRHGIVDFVRFDPVAHRFSFHDSGASQADSIFTRLSDAGVTCGSIFLPRNYPPFPLHDGYVVSGFETPNTECKFTYPSDLRDEVLGISPDLHFNFENDWGDASTDEGFAQNIERGVEAIDLLERMAVHFQRDRPVKVQVAYLQATDILFHKAWRWCDTRTCNENPYRREQIKKFFRRVDQMLNRVFGLHSSASQRMRPGGAGGPGRTLRLICSDHGHGPSNGRVFINNLLQEWGYLKQLGSLGRASRQFKLLTTFDAAARRTKSREMGLDWSATKAYLAHVGIYGFVYMNLRGREPQGIIAPEDFEAERDRLIARFMKEKIPGTDQQLFVKVYKGEEIYARKKELNLPDLVVVPADGYYPRKKLTRGPSVRSTPNSVGGVHRSEGVYAFEGDGIIPSLGVGARASIADIAPTLLAALGQPVPRAMTGRPIPEIFEIPPPTQYVDDNGFNPTIPRSDVYSKDEEQEIEKRLSDLGYLE